MSTIDQTDEAKRVLERAMSTAPSAGAAAGMLLRGVVSALDVVGRPEGAAIARAIDAGVALVGPGGLACLKAGDYPGVAEAVVEAVSRRCSAAALDIVKRRFDSRQQK